LKHIQVRSDVCLYMHSVTPFIGPGALSRALLELPKERVRKLIILEDVEHFQPYLEALEAADPRVTVIMREGYQWDAYNKIDDQGLLADVSKLPWSAGVHPQLQFISHLPHNVRGEQLVSQLLRCVPDESWLFRYGRVPLGLVLGDWMHTRLSAVEKTTARCKVSVIAQAVADIQPALPAYKLKPYEEHFHPIPSLQVMAKMNELRSEAKRAGHPHVALNVVPLEKPLIRGDMLDKWDYVLRRMFVKKSTSLKKGIP
jgi:mitochondrial transcription factor 1